MGRTSRVWVMLPWWGWSMLAVIIFPLATIGPIGVSAGFAQGADGQVPDGQLRDGRIQAPVSAAYLLVLDHSGSMLVADQPTDDAPTGKTRWQALKENVQEFVKTVPLESLIWIAIFSEGEPDVFEPPFATEADRQELLRRIEQQFVDPTPQARTWLYETLAVAFRKAEQLSNDNKGRNISVILYSDGEDNRSPEATKESLARDFGRLVDENENLWIFIRTIGEQGARPEDVMEHERVLSADAQKHSLAMTLTPSAVRLKNPKAAVRQTFEVEYATTEAAWKLVDGTSLSFDFVPDDDQPLQVKVPQMPFRRGRIQLELEVMNPDQVQLDQDYSGQLRIRYPELDKHAVGAGDFIRLTFQQGEKIAIDRCIPEPGARFAAGQEIQFKVWTQRGADVTWEFGDGQSASGPDVRHLYNTPGARQVKLTVVDDQGLSSEEREFEIEIVDVGLSIDPVIGPVISGVPYRFTCRARGDIQRFEWLAGGNTFAGQTPAAGADHASELTYAFDYPGEQTISVVGYAEGARPVARLVVPVQPGPRIVVTPPSPCPFSEPVQFELESPPGWEEVAWDFGDGTTLDGGNRSTATHRYTMRGAFRVEATLAWKDVGTLTLDRSINVVAEPVKAVPRVFAERGPGRIVVGHTINLNEESTGDIVSKTWIHNGQALAPNQMSLTLDRVGEHRLVLRVEGPRDVRGFGAEGSVLLEGEEPPTDETGVSADDPYVDEALVAFIVCPPRPWYAFVLGVLAALVLLWIAASWLFGNAPAAWLIYAAHDRALWESDGRLTRQAESTIEDLGNRRPMRKYWRWWILWPWWPKHAEVPARDLFPECDYWHSPNPGAECFFRVGVVWLNRDWKVDVTYSRDRGVVKQSRSISERTTDFLFVDPAVVCRTEGSSGEDDQGEPSRRDTSCQAMYVRVVEKPASLIGSVLGLIGVLALLATGLWFLYRWVVEFGG
jgi:PKD repeat protein